MAIRSQPQARTYRQPTKNPTPEEWDRILRKRTLRELLEELAKDADPEIAALARTKLAKLPPDSP